MSVCVCMCGRLMGLQDSSGADASVRPTNLLVYLQPSSSDVLALEHLLLHWTCSCVAHQNLGPAHSHKTHKHTHTHSSVNAKDEVINIAPPTVNVTFTFLGSAAEA